MTSADRKKRGYPTFVTLGAVLAILAGLIGLGTIAYWYATDMGWTGSGSTIVEPRAPIVAAALVPATSVLFGLVTLLIRSDVPARSPRGVALLTANLLLGASVWFGVNAYPQVEPATLIGLEENGTVEWRTQLPVTEVVGVRDESDTTITLEGRADRRGCEAEPRSMVIDRSTGEVLAVDTLPTVYTDMSEVPPPPTPLQPGRSGFAVEQGSAPFICRN